MCYTGSCPFELWSGECKHRLKDGPYPCEFETSEDYHKAKENFSKERDEFIFDEQLEVKNDYS